VGPLKLKIHSSLERVYDKLKERCSLDGGQEVAKAYLDENNKSGIVSRLEKSMFEPQESIISRNNEYQRGLSDYY
jgi:hypothetical protein